MTAPDPNRRLRVLAVVDLITSLGGAERIAAQIATALDPTRFESAICVTRTDACYSHESIIEDLRRSGVRLIRLERRTALDLRPWRRLTTYLREWGVDVIHAHKTGSNFWSALLNSRVGDPVFVAHEHGWSDEDAVARLIDRHLVARRADAFIAVSESERRQMIEAGGIPRDKIRVITNGIVTPQEPDPGHDVRRALGIEPSQPVVGIVATLRPEKAIEVLVRATIPLSREFPEVRVLIAGGETQQTLGERDRLERLVREVGASDSVTLLGPRLDIPELLAAFNVAVLCSTRESSSLSTMEYMEAAKPVVATRVGNLPALVEDGVTGRLVDPNDPDGLASAIAELLRDPALAESMGQAGRERCRREFSIEVTTRRFEDLYEELYAAKTAERSAVAIQ